MSWGLCGFRFECVVAVLELIVGTVDLLVPTDAGAAAFFLGAITLRRWESVTVRVEFKPVCVDEKCVMAILQWMLI